MAFDCAVVKPHLGHFLVEAEVGIAEIGALRTVLDITVVTLAPLAGLMVLEVNPKVALRGVLTRAVDNGVQVEVAVVVCSLLVVAQDLCG